MKSRETPRMGHSNPSWDQNDPFQQNEPSKESKLPFNTRDRNDPRGQNDSFEFTVYSVI